MILNFLSNKNSKENNLRKFQIAVVALFLELAKSDNNFANVEFKKIINLVKNKFSIDDEKIHELIDIANDFINKSISIYEITEIINSHFNDEEKYELVKDLWEIVYADNELHKYEEHLVRIITYNLKLSHKDLIAAKLEVKNKKAPSQ